jgi:hypothetical protein
VNELSSYVFSPLREGDIALYRGTATDLAPILLVAAEETSPGSVERLEHEYALKAELDADWAARPVALTHDNGRMTLVLEDPGGAPVDRLLSRPLEVSHFLRIAIPLAGALPQTRRSLRSMLPILWRVSLRNHWLPRIYAAKNRNISCSKSDVPMHGKSFRKAASSN